MNELGWMVYVAVFLAMPPALLVTRLFDRASMPWALVLGASVIGGWLLANLAYMFYVNAFVLRMSALGTTRFGPGDYPDAGPMLKYGWLLGPAYLLPWLMLYCVLVFARWMWGTSSAFRRH